MPFTTKVISDIEIYLSSEVKSEIIQEDQEFKYPLLTFTTYYIPLKDEGGYHPPKYLVLDGVINDLVKEELISMNKSKEYKPDYDIDYDDINMNTIYIMEDKIEEISKDDLKLYKRTQFTVPISKKKRKLPPLIDNNISYYSGEEKLDEDNNLNSPPPLKISKK